MSILGRVRRVYDSSGLDYLANKPDRKFVFVSGMDTLGKYQTYEDKFDFLMSLGFEYKYLERKIKEQNQFKMILFDFDDNINSYLATWDNISGIIAQQYPMVAITLDNIIDVLKTKPFREIEKESGFSWTEIEQQGPEHELYMTYERFLQSNKTLYDVRKFLYFTISLNELFDGSGYSYHEDGTKSNKEYLIPNYKLNDLDCIIFDIPITNEKE